MGSKTSLVGKFLVYAGFIAAFIFVYGSLEPASQAAIDGVPYFDGSTNVHRTNENLGIENGEITMGGWVRVTTQPALNSISHLFLKGSSVGNIVYRTKYRDSGGTKQLQFGRSRLGLGDDYATIDYTLQTNQWYYITYLYNGNAQHGFVNGVEIGSGVSTGNGSSGAQNCVTVGADSACAGAGDYLTGNMADFVVYNVALSTSTSRIQNLMTQRPPDNDNGLVLFWQMKEGVGPGFFDVVQGKDSNGGNGAITWQPEHPHATYYNE